LGEIRLAYSSLPCDGWSLEDHLDNCRRNGFAGIEFREDPQGLVYAGMPVAEARAIGEALREAGIAATDIGTGVCFRGVEDESGGLAHLEAAARLAEAIGARGLRVFLGNFAVRHDAPKAPISHEGIVQRLRDACDIAAVHGREIWLETHNEYATGAVIRPLLDEVGRLNFKVIYDILHPLEDGEDIRDTIRLLGGDCAHVHLKDGVRSADPVDHDWIYTLFGQGEAPIGEIVALLRESGFEGHYSLEWETKWRKELQAPGMEAEKVFPEYARIMNALEPGGHHR
jgi:sugar phosphate isomerase/epimerase